MRAGSGVHPALLGADPNEIPMPRLGRVPPTIPTSLLLGTPPSTNLGNLHHSAAGLTHGGRGLMAIPSVAHQNQLQSLGSLGGSLREAVGYADAHRFAPSGSRQQIDDYIRQHMDGRGG